MTYDIIISAISTIVVAFVSGLFLRESKRHKRDAEKTEARAQIRATESLLNLKLSSANMTLSLVTAEKMRGGDPNGELDKAVESARAAQREYFDFINGVFAKQAAKI